MSSCGGELGTAPVSPRQRRSWGQLVHPSAQPRCRLTEKQGLCPGFESHLCVLPAR